MKRALLVVILIFSVMFLYGCYSTAPVVDQTVIDEADSVPPEEEQIVHVLHPEKIVDVAEKETVVEEEKQIATGGTDVNEEKPSIISNVECSYGLEGPEKFSFTLNNIEDKKWVFNSLSYTARETSDNPIIVLNALQVANQQMQEACVKKSLAVGASVVCDFNLDSLTHTLVRKSIRTGMTALGSENENTLSVRTSAHAAEVRFLCE